MHDLPAGQSKELPAAVVRFGAQAHPWLMRRTATLTMVFLVALGALTVSVALGAQSRHPGGTPAFAAADPDDSVAADLDDDDEGQDRATTRERGGPPPWAHAVAKDKAKTGLDAWKRLAPGEREQLMTRLVRDHRAGMEAFRACRDDGRKDCAKPLPPGLAKR